MWTALPHVDERQLLFQGDLTLVSNEDRERESQSERRCFYLPPLAHPFHPMISKLPCALRPLPGERFPSRPQMKKLACFPAFPRQPPVGRGGGARRGVWRG